MSRRTLKLGAILIGVGGPGQHSTWLNPEIPGNASVDIRWYIARESAAQAWRAPVLPDHPLPPGRP